MKNRVFPEQAGVLVLAALLLITLGGCALTTHLGLTGDHAPAQLVATLDVSRETRAMEFSPDGKQLAVYQTDLAEIQIWDWQNKRILHALPASRGADARAASRPIRYSPDGRLFAACLYQPDGSVAAQIWSTVDWTLEQDITDPGHTGGCNAVMFTGDSRSLLRLVDRPETFEQDTLVMYDTRTWKIKMRLHIPGFHPYSLSMNRDSHVVALGGVSDAGPEPAPQIVLVDLANQRVVRTIQNRLTGPSGHIAWSPDGAHIAVTGDEGAEIFDEQTGALAAEDRNGGLGALIRYSPDGRYLVESGFDRAGDVVRIWDAEHHITLQEIGFKPSSMAVSRSGDYFALGGDRMIQIWQFK
jgi:WD40 repeat protein